MTVEFPNNISKIDVLHALWERSKPSSFYNAFPSMAPDFNISRAFERGLYVDYCCGRSIKTNFKTFPILDNLDYDRDNGEGAMEEVRDKLITNKCI